MKTAKISSIILYAALGISLGILAVFYFGGVNTAVSADNFDKTSLFLYWTYFLLSLCFVVTCIFSGIKFGQTFHRNPRTFWRNFIVFSGILILFGITWLLGNGDPIQSLKNLELGNTYFWLKLTDMFLYAIYVLLGLTVLAVPCLYVYKLLKK